jgi:hypothetical protein
MLENDSPVLSDDLSAGWGEAVMKEVQEEILSGNWLRGSLFRNQFATK